MITELGNSLISWQLLAITSYPSFEINILKNYWTNKGNGFLWRTAITEGRFKETAINSPLDHINEITKSALNKFDFLLIDISSWNKLSRAKRTRINRQIYSEGLGLLLLPEKVGQKAITIDHPNIREYREEPSDPSQSHYILSNGWEKILMNNREIGRYQSYGLGHRIILTNDQSYQNALSNQKDQYDKHWNKLLSIAYRQYDSDHKLISNKWIWSHEQNIVLLLSRTPIRAPIILNDTDVIPAIRHPIISDLYELTVIPEKGYNSISFNDEKLRFYAQDPSDWPLVRDSLFNQSKSFKTDKKIDSEYIEAHPISPYYGLVLVLIGLGGLWLDERLN